jgi:hypothetical protein
MISVKRQIREVEMSYLGRALGNKGYDVIQMPQHRDAVDRSFAKLPPDPYYAGRRRRFSQYVMYYEYSGWNVTKLERRPFIQSKKYNRKVGGVLREFDPIDDFDPRPYFAAIAERLDLDKNECYQVNFHNWRTLVGNGNTGTIVPEGPHRDGHHITSVTIWNRKNIKGGVSQVFSVGEKPELLFETTLDNGQCLVMNDDDVIHGATDITVASGETGERDTWVISINPWSDRRYGVDHEARAQQG